MPGVSIIILNWNGLHFLGRFLPSVINTNYPDFEIVLADNASSDGSVAFVRENFPQTRLVCFDRNYGFAGGNNRAVSYAKGEYVVLLNTDVEVHPGWLSPLVDFMNKNPETAACQPKILSYADRTKFEYAGAAGGFMDRFGYPFCRGRIFDVCETDQGQYNENRKIFWASGACMCVRRTVWEKAGGFDEDFFAHMEEIDWCWRAQREGHEIYCIPQSVVYHVGAGSLPKENPKKIFLNYRNNLIMLEKNLPSYSVLLILMIRLLLDHFSAYRYLLRGSFSCYFAILKAHCNFLFYQSKWIGKRKGKMIKMREGMYRASVVWHYFVGGKRKFTDYFYLA